MHYHDELGVFHTVEIEEDFETLGESSDDYDPHIKGNSHHDNTFRDPGRWNSLPYRII